MEVLSKVKSQIKLARNELRSYRPDTIDWSGRAIAFANSIVPWLIEVAPGMKSYVEDVLNAPATIRSMWATIRRHVDLPEERIDAFDRQLALDEILRESVTGEVISSVVTKFLINHHPTSKLKSNGRSDFPDIFDSTLDYSALPPFKRWKQLGVADEYGAALKGKEKRPVRVPDGLEIKTCRDRIAVDCHHPHAGLHLVLLYSISKRVFEISDICIAFLGSCDYRESDRNTTATTVKYSFNSSRFISVLKRL